MVHLTGGQRLLMGKLFGSIVQIMFQSLKKGSMIHYKNNIFYEDSSNALIESTYLKNRTDFKMSGSFGVSRDGKESIVIADSWICYGHLNFYYNHSSLYGRLCFVVRLVQGDIDVLSLKEILTENGIDAIVTTEYGVKLDDSVKIDSNHSYSILHTKKPDVVLL
jgi:hypothetical protein